MKNRLAALLSVVALVSLLGACGKSNDNPAVSGDATTTTAKTNTLAIEAKEYAFDLPKTAEAGLVTINFKNAGTMPHVASLNRVDAGKGVADVLAELNKQTQGPPPAWLHASGGPLQNPGGTKTFTTNLDPGTYVIYCPVPGPDGKPHFASGMIGQIELTGGTKGTLPTADTTVTAKDFTWDGLETLKAGDQTVKFSNAGKENHEAAIFELAPGKTIDDLTKFLGSQSAPSGPPPFVGIPGLALEAPVGQDAVTKLTLKAGTTYGVLCFVGNAKGPHFMQGMAKEIHPA